MIIYHIYKCAGVKPVIRPEYFFGLPGSGMCICKSINGTVQGDSLLNAERVVQFLFAFYIITDQVTGQYIRIIKGKVCVCQVIDTGRFSASYRVSSAMTGGSKQCLAVYRE